MVLPLSAITFRGRQLADLPALQTGYPPSTGNLSSFVLFYSSLCGVSAATYASGSREC